MKFRDFLFQNGEEAKKWSTWRGRNIVMRALVASVALLGTSFGGGYVQTGDVPDNAVRSSGVSQMVDRGPVGQFKALENDSQMTGIPAYLPWYCLFFPRFTSCQTTMPGV